MKTIITFLLMTSCLVGFAAEREEVVPSLIGNLGPGSNFVGGKAYHDYKYILDSITTEKGSKTHYAYDDSCNVTLESYSTWNEEANRWFITEKEEYTYTAKGDISTEAHYYGDSLGQVIGDYKKVRSFDDTEDTLLTEKYYYWNTNDWKNSADYIVRYATKGSITTANAYAIYEDFEMLAKQTLEEQTSDTTGTETHLYRPDNNPDTMLYDYKMEYIYNSKAQIVKTTRLNWAEDTQSWNNYFQKHYTYNDANKTSLFTSELWIDSLSQWQMHYKNIYAYDTNKNPQTYTYMVWNEDLNSLTNDVKYEFTYDDYKNRTSRTNYTWDENTSDWIAHHRAYDYDFDFDVELYETLLPPAYQSITLLKINSASTEDLTDDTWVKNPNSIYHYSSPQAASLHEETTPTFEIYPNPASDCISIVWPQGMQEGTFTLWDISGKCMMTRFISSEQTIDIQNIPSDYYICKITSKNETFTNMLIIK